MAPGSPNRAKYYGLSELKSRMECNADLTLRTFRPICHAH
jgi:hypothetical protein